jgi:hypothetical protein
MVITSSPLNQFKPRGCAAANLAHHWAHLAPPEDRGCPSRSTFELRKLPVAFGAAYTLCALRLGQPPSGIKMRAPSPMIVTLLLSPWLNDVNLLVIMQQLNSTSIDKFLCDIRF